MKPLTHVVTHEMCVAAASAAAKMLEHLVSVGAIKPADDGSPRDGAYVVIAPRTEDGRLGEPLFANCVGNATRAKKYVAFAFKKAGMSARERRSTRYIISTQRGLKPGDTKYPGGIWSRDLDLAIGISGLPSRWDEALAYMMEAYLRAIVYGYMEDESEGFLHAVSQDPEPDPAFVRFAG